MAISSISVNNPSDILETSFNTKNSIDKLLVKVNDCVQTNVDWFLEKQVQHTSLASKYSMKVPTNVKKADKQTISEMLKNAKETLKKADKSVDNKKEIKQAKKALRKANRAVLKAKIFNSTLEKAFKSTRKALNKIDDATVREREREINKRYSGVVNLKTKLETVQKEQCENTAIDEIDLYSPIDAKGLPEEIQKLVDGYNKEIETLKQDYKKAVADISEQVKIAVAADPEGISGTFGTVHKSGNYVIKLANEGFDEEFDDEVKNNKDLKAGLEAAKGSGKNLEGLENLTAFVGATKINGQTAIVYERVDGKDLYDRLYKDYKDNMTSVQKTMAMIGFTKGLQTIHDAGIVHNDIKTENVMITKNFLAKIIDFGLSKKIGEPKAFGGGTPGYMAPEIFNANISGSFSSKSDIFSTGVLLLETFLGNTNFGSSIISNLASEQSKKGYIDEFSMNELYYTLKEALEDESAFEKFFNDTKTTRDGKKIDSPEFTEKQFKSILQLITPCFNIDPDQRPTAGELNDKLKSLLQEMPAPKEKHGIPVPPAVPPPPPEDIPKPPKERPAPPAVPPPPPKDIPKPPKERPAPPAVKPPPPKDTPKPPKEKPAPPANRKSDFDLGDAHLSNLP